MKFAVFAVLLAAVFIQNSVASSCYGKNVEVTVINGIGLAGTGLFRSDPYVEVTIGDVSKRTKMIHSAHDPFWYQGFLFHNVDSDEMKIDVWEREAGYHGGDHHIGTCSEKLSYQYDEFTTVECYVGTNGIVNLKYKCYSSSQERKY